MQVRRFKELDSMTAVTMWCRQAFGRLGGIGGVGKLVSVNATGELSPEGDLAKWSSADDREVCAGLYRLPDFMSMATPTVLQPKWLGVTGEFCPDLGLVSACPQTERPRPTDPPISDLDFRRRPGCVVLGLRTGWFASLSTSSRSSRLDGNRLTNAVSINLLPLRLRCIVSQLRNIFFITGKRPTFFSTSDSSLDLRLFSWSWKYNFFFFVFWVEKSIQLNLINPQLNKHSRYPHLKEKWKRLVHFYSILKHFYSLINTLELTYLPTRARITCKVLIF